MSLCFNFKSLVENTVGKGLIKATDWDPSQPNRLTLTLNSGIKVFLLLVVNFQFTSLTFFILGIMLKVENLVTKRSFDLSANGQFDTSEYSKQVILPLEFSIEKNGKFPSFDLFEGF